MVSAKTCDSLSWFLSTTVFLIHKINYTYFRYYRTLQTIFFFNLIQLDFTTVDTNICTHIYVTASMCKTFEFGVFGGHTTSQQVTLWGLNT